MNIGGGGVNGGVVVEMRAARMVIQVEAVAGVILSEISLVMVILEAEEVVEVY